MKKSIVLCIWLFAGQCFGQTWTWGSGVIDIDGNHYLTVILGSQEWMCYNLRTTKFANGVSIPNITDNLTWYNLNYGAWCNYGNDNNGQFDYLYGKLYNGYVVDDKRNVCPTGWHVPHSNEWDTLVNYLGGALVAGGKMKTTGTYDGSSQDGVWYGPNFGATNSSKFFCVPSGARMQNMGEFTGLGFFAHYWSSNTFPTTSESAEINLSYLNTIVQTDTSSNRFGYSIRCIKGIEQSSILGLIELNETPPELIKIIDLMGRESENRPNTVLIYIYSDGSTKKVFKVD